MARPGEGWYQRGKVWWQDLPSVTAFRSNIAPQAKVTLDRARYFLRQSNACAAGGDWWSCETNLLAAIQFGRSVTLHLKAELDGEAWFAAWYAEHEQYMRKDRLMGFFLDFRNAIVHVRVPTSTTEERTETHSPTLVLGWNVLEAEPPGRWYTWSVPTILRVSRKRAKRPIDTLKLKIQLRLEARRRARLVGRTYVIEDLYFDDPDWNARSARELAAEYLGKLDDVLVALPRFARSEERERS